ncbi:MAG: hypothetical protein DRI86_10990 [Bacteroidetes bacterium]|nr:MAG: hypothetical protein DRI86_10990 [Bacteroidota bacterium]
MTTKYITSIIIAILISISSFAQEKGSETPFLKVGISYSSFGNNPIVYSPSLDGGAGYEGVDFYTIGFVVIKPFTKNLELETGLEYSEHTIKIIPNLPPENTKMPYNVEKTLWSIPIGIRYNFLNYFYLNGGAFLDFDSSLGYELENQQGIGAYIGLGAKYDFNFGLSLFLTPYYKAHSLIPFKTQGSQGHLMETGFKMGALYAF